MTPQQLLDFVDENFRHSPRVDIVFDNYLNTAPESRVHRVCISIQNIPPNGDGVYWSMEYVSQDMSGVADFVKRTTLVNAERQRREAWFRERHIDFWRRGNHAKTV